MTENTTPTPPEPEHRYAFTGAVTGIARCTCGAAWTAAHEAATTPTSAETTTTTLHDCTVDETAGGAETTGALAAALAPEGRGGEGV